MRRFLPLAEHQVAQDGLDYIIWTRSTGRRLSANCCLMRAPSTMTTDPVSAILHDPRFQGQPITWDITPETYDAVRHAWLTHVAAEEHLFRPYTESEWQEQMATMLSVFSEECVMEIVPTGESWHGHDGADAFYRAFIPSFSGMEWVPQSLVIGPQGVLDVVNMTGALVRPFAGLTAVGEAVALQWVIAFPWLPEEGRFRGETIYSIRPLGEIERTAFGKT